MNYAVQNSNVESSYSEDELYEVYLSLDAEKDAMIKQAEAIKDISAKESCVFVGRGADYILKENPNLVKIFLYAPLDYRIQKIQEMYKDSYKDAKKYILNSDKARTAYYEVITNQKWGASKNYDICINCNIGSERVIDIICNYIKSTISR